MNSRVRVPGEPITLNGSIFAIVQKRTLAEEREEVGFGAWLSLGLEFELAADVVRSALSPAWQDIG